MKRTCSFKEKNTSRKNVRRQMKIRHPLNQGYSVFMLVKFLKIQNWKAYSLPQSKVSLEKPKEPVSLVLY